MDRAARAFCNNAFSALYIRKNASVFSKLESVSINRLKKHSKKSKQNHRNGASWFAVK